MINLTLKQLIDVGVHVGHSFKNTLLFSSWMLFSFRRNLWFINLLKTLYMWKIALKFVLKSVNFRSPFWFVNLDKSLSAVMQQITFSSGEFCCTNYWTGGLLNNKEVLSNIWALKKKRGSGNRKVSFIYFKKGLFFSRLSWPRLVFVSSLNYSYPCVKEALSSKLYCIAITDTDIRSQAISIPIPGNDSNLLSTIFYIKSMASYILLNKFFLVFGWYVSIRTSPRLISFKNWLLSVKFQKFNDVLKKRKFHNIILYKNLSHFFSLNCKKDLLKVSPYVLKLGSVHKLALLKFFYYYKNFFFLCEATSAVKLNNVFKSSRVFDRRTQRFAKGFSRYRKPNWAYYVKTLWFFKNLNLENFSKKIMYFSLLYMFSKFKALAYHFMRFKTHLGTSKWERRTYLKRKFYHKYLFFTNYSNLTLRHVMCVKDKTGPISWFFRFFKKRLKFLRNRGIIRRFLIKNMKRRKLIFRKKIWKVNYRGQPYYKLKKKYKLVSPPIKLVYFKWAPYWKSDNFFIGNWIINTSIDTFFWKSSQNYFKLKLNPKSNKFFYFWRFLFLKKVKISRFKMDYGPSFFLFFFNNWFSTRYSFFSKHISILRRAYVWKRSLKKKNKFFFFCFTNNKGGAFKWRSLGNSFLFYYNLSIFYKLLKKRYAK